MKIQSISSAPVALPSNPAPAMFAGRPVIEGGQDQFQIRFGATHHVPFPKTIAESRWANNWVQMDRGTLQRELVVALDEIMTTTGEAYAKDAERLKENKRAEAFTTLIDVTFHPEALKGDAGTGKRDASTEAQVEHAYTVRIPAKPERNRPEMNLGNMVISSSSRDYDTGKMLASAKATFVAVDSDSVKAGKNKPVAVRDLEVVSEGDKTFNEEARQWEQGLRDFYKTVSQSVEVSPHPDLAAVDESATRSVTTNMYVKTDMLNKKKTGHGGITAAMALDHMGALARRFLNEQGVDHNGVRVSDFTASFAKPYLETDALQFDTTLDHIDSAGNIYMSSRISKHDTQGGQVTGPVFLVHARLSRKAPTTPTGIFRWFLSKPTPPMLPAPQDDGTRTRRDEAIQWAALRES